MKIDFRILFLGALFLIIYSCAHAQEKSVKDTTIKGVTYKLYVGAKGGRYINVTSKKDTTHTYRRYFKRG
jgi:hypothetical protein